MAKRKIVKPTKRNKRKFANSANKTHVKNLRTSGMRGGIRL